MRGSGECADPATRRHTRSTLGRDRGGAPRPAPGRGGAPPVRGAGWRRGGGYGGALGSRRTQEARGRAWETAGVSDAELAGLHGPTGLDLGAPPPGETAVSIAAEIIAVRSGR